METLKYFIFDVCGVTTGGKMEDVLYEELKLLTLLELKIMSFVHFLVLWIPREFCGMVRKILIVTKEEVQRMNPGTLISKGEETSSVAEGTDAKEMKNIPTSSSSNLGDF